MTRIVHLRRYPHTFVFNSQRSFCVLCLKVCLQTIHLSIWFFLSRPPPPQPVYTFWRFATKKHIIHRHIPHPIFKWNLFAFLVHWIFVRCCLQPLLSPVWLFFSIQIVFIVLPSFHWSYRTTVSEEDIRDAFTKNNFEIKAFKFFP